MGVPPSFPCCAETEEDAGERTGEAARNEIPTGDEREYARVCEDEPGDYGCDEESFRCSETHPRKFVRFFPDPAGMRPLTLSRTIDKVDKTMADIQEQTQLAAEIQEQISSPPVNADLDEVRYQLQVPGLIIDHRDSHTLV